MARPTRYTDSAAIEDIMARRVRLEFAARNALLRCQDQAQHTELDLVLYESEAIRATLAGWHRKALRRSR